MRKIVDKKEILRQLNQLKKHTFDELLNLAGRAYILVKYSENVKVGSRGFLPEEKERGLVLVLNSKMNFVWDDYGITTKLAFGNSIQKCFIPTDDIIAVYSLELNSQLVIGPQSVSEANVPEEKRKDDNGRDKGESSSSQEGRGKKKKVVRVDFQKKRK